MADILIKRLEEEIKKQRFNLKSLSLAAGLGETAVRDIVTGRARNPRRDTIRKLATTLGKPVLYFIEEESRVPLTDTGMPGKAKSSGRGGVREHAAKAGGGEFAPAPPESGHRDLAAVRQRGDAMLPFLPEGTILYHGTRLESDFDDVCLGKLCVVQIQGGPLGVYIMKRGDTYGRYHLMNYNAPVREDASIEWCAPVLFIRPA